MPSSEFKLHLLVLSLDSFLLFSPLVEILSQVIDNTTVMMSVLLPENAKLILIRLRDMQDRITNFKPILDQCLKIGLIVVLDVDSEISLSFVEPDIR